MYIQPYVHITGRGLGLLESSRSTLERVVQSSASKAGSRSTLSEGGTEQRLTSGQQVDVCEGGTMQRLTNDLSILLEAFP